MPAFETRLRVVRNFVLVEARFRKDFHRQSVLVSLQFLINRVKLSPFATRPELSPFFESQAIGRNMSRLQLDRLLQGVMPVFKRLPRHAKDQVKRHILESCP